jgi:DNA-binding CsgD family transcriptional regulator/PAS domain-containing protein
VAKNELPDTPQDRTELTVHRNGSQSIDALEAGPRHCANIFDFLPDATFVIDRTGKVTVWNKAIEEMTRIPKPEIIGKGDYAYAVPFYGKSRPMLIDLALNPAADGTGGYDFVTRSSDTVVGETYVPDAYGGTGAYVRGVASALHDQDRNLIGAIEFIRDISSRKRLEELLRQREKELEDKTGQIEEINTTLRVLLKNREDDRRRLGNDILSNLKQLVLPYLTRVKHGRLDQNQKTYLEVVESSLNKILSPFIANMSSAFHTLSPTEIQIAHLIMEGKRTKEIASLLHAARKTVETHRYNLRIKLGIQNEKINLRSYLLSIK